MTDSAISSVVQRMLGDSKEASRKKGVTEVAEAAKHLFEDYPPAEADGKALGLFNTFEATFLRSAQPASRRGGVSAIAAIACAIPKKVTDDRLTLIGTFCETILKMFKDVDPVVRSLAVEAMMNVVAHLQHNALTVCFGAIFKYMLVVVSDKDLKVQQACAELSNVVKEVCAESPPCFDMAAFVDFVVSGLSRFNASPDAVCFVLDWIHTVQQVPNRNLLSELKHFLGPLIQLVGHGNRSVVIKTEETLESFLRQVKLRGTALDAKILMLQVLPFTAEGKSRSRFVCATWAEQLLRIGREQMLPIADQLIRNFLQRISDTDSKVTAITRTSLDQLAELLYASALSSSSSVLAIPRLLSEGLLLGAFSSKSPVFESNDSGAPLSPSARDATMLPLPMEGEQNERKEPATDLAPNAPPTLADVNFSSVVAVFVDALKLPKSSRLELLQWSVLVYSIHRQVILESFDSLFPALLSMLTDPDGEVLYKSIEVLATIAGEDKFSHFINALVDLLEKEKELMLGKVSIIFKRLQEIYMRPMAVCDSPRGLRGAAALDSPRGGNEGASSATEEKSTNCCEKLLLQTAALLSKHSNKSFAATLVIKLTSLLLTAEEFMTLREVLKKGMTNERAKATFAGLYDCWCYNAVSLISLTLLTKAYGLTYTLVELLGAQESTVHTLVQLDRLVQLLEAPVFAFVRMALLSPRSNAPLVKALFGIQMILPQSSPQFNSLRQRLKAVTAVSYIAESDMKDQFLLPVDGERTGAKGQSWETGLISQYSKAQSELVEWELNNAPSGRKKDRK